MPTIRTTSEVELLTGSQWLEMVTTARAAITAETASSTGMPAATSAPKTTSSRISVMGTEVASAWRKFSESSMARPMLSSPVSAIRRPGWPTWTVATARWSAATSGSALPFVCGTWKVTRALRPSAEIREVPPGLRGDLMLPASSGRRRSDATTSRAACCMVALRAKVSPGARAWMSTVSSARP